MVDIISHNGKLCIYNAIEFSKDHRKMENCFRFKMNHHNISVNAIISNSLSDFINFFLDFDLIHLPNVIFQAFLLHRKYFAIIKTTLYKLYGILLIILLFISLLGQKGFQRQLYTELLVAVAIAQYWCFSITGRAQ